MVNLALMGEIAGNAATTELGYRLIDDWLQYAQTADLHEFSSPTYYWVQINSLYMGYLYARRPGAQAMFRAILDHTWADIAANYFAPSQTISGPKSRDYDFLFGHGEQHAVRRRYLPRSRLLRVLVVFAQERSWCTRTPKVSRVRPTAH